MLPAILRKAARESGIGYWNEDEGWVLKDRIPANKAIEFIELTLCTWAAAQAAGSIPVAPTKDRLIVRAAVKPDVTEGGIALPEVTREHRDEAVVLGCGGEVFDIYPGDRVLFQKRSGVVLKYGEDELRVLKYDDVIAKLEIDDPA